MNIKVRFAPSPTGHLHIGGARTALFNWLVARQHAGTMILRVEDTDLQRSSKKMVEGILEGLTWLGLSWDEGPFFQSKRHERHRTIAEHLLQAGNAYRDFSSPEDPPQEYRKYRDCTPDEIEVKLTQGIPFAVRFRIPEQKTIRFHDEVYSDIEVDAGTLEDFVILRSDGLPTYHLSVVVDDIDMEITHVIRGGDHLSNTSKHILLYEALEKKIPAYAHLPLILGPDRKRLSKRHGATSVLEYRKQGILPTALLNYLALLGWSPGTDREIYSIEELIREFRLDRVNKANAIFDSQKIQWMNGQHISMMTAERLEPFVRETLQSANIWNPDWGNGGRQWFLSTIDLLKSRIYLLGDFATFGRAYFSDDFEYDEDAEKRYLEFDTADSRHALAEALEELRDAYSQLDSFDVSSIEEILRGIATRRGLKTGAFIGAIRVAATGQSKAPGIFDVLTTLGRDRTLARLDRVIHFLRR